MPAIDDRGFVVQVGQVRTPLSESDLARLRPLLADRSISVSIRVQAAGRALTSLPDTIHAVRGIVRPLTSGLSPLRRLERLRQLQHQVETNRSLDALIDRREARLKMDCPRCGRRYPRETMVRHLWHEHGLLLERGKVRSPRRTVRELKAEHADSRDTTVLDRASLLADEAAIRAWMAGTDPSEDDLAPLRAEAAERGYGLCPGCFAERPASLPPLPPPLAVARGRLAGDGFFVQIGGGDWFRTITVATPAKTIHFGPAGRGTVGMRGLASFAALLILVVAFSVVVFGSKAWATPAVAGRLLALAAAAYVLVRFVRRPPPRADDQTVDAAWAHLVPHLHGAKRSSEWLTRLCRSSFGAGDPAARAGWVKALIERGEEGTTTADVQLLAAAAVLQAFDRGRMGHDRAAAIADLIASGLRGERSTAFTEYAAECYWNGNPKPPVAERARVRMLLLAAAFDAVFTPRDLSELWAAAPNLRRVMSVEPLHRLALLHGVWSMQADHRWERIARADSAFELCRTAPNVSGRLLVDFPDLLLCHRPDPDTEAKIGPVMVCTRGIVVGGVMLADPQTEVRLEKTAGRIELIFGPNRFTLERTPVGDLAGKIREWLRFRAWALLPLLDNYLVASSHAVSTRALKPFRSRCPNCGTIAFVHAGEAGIKS